MHSGEYRYGLLGVMAHPPNPCNAKGRINTTHGPSASSKRNVFLIHIQIDVIGDTRSGTVGSVEDKASWKSLQLGRQVR